MLVGYRCFTYNLGMYIHLQAYNYGQNNDTMKFVYSNGGGGGVGESGAFLCWITSET